MFARLSRLFRAWMGFFISVGEDPEVMLQDAIEEMRMTMPKLNSVLVATRATVIRLEEEREALLRQDKQPHRLDSGGAARRVGRRPQRGRRRRAAAAAAAHGPGRAPGTAGLGAESARERQAVGRRAQGQAQGADRDEPARDEGAAEGAGDEAGGRCHRRAAVLRRGLDRRQVPRADQAGSRRVEGGRRSRDRRDRHAAASSASAPRASSRPPGILQQFEAEMGISAPPTSTGTTVTPSVGSRVGEKPKT